jgi:phage/plasmid-associated DNA primase
MCKLLSRINYIELRTKLLHERFEIGRYRGKLLLAGIDVPGDFLNTEGAQALKKLSGHDALSGEMKGSMDDLEMYGDFAIIITSNETLQVHLEGETDVEAWRNRLAIVNFSGKPPPVKIPNFENVLLAQEAEGILLEIVKGACLHLAEIEKKGDFEFTSEQLARVNALLEESESVRHFVNSCVSFEKGSEGVSTEEMSTAYVEFCQDRSWRPLGVKTVERTLPDVILRKFGVHVGANIERDGVRKRGYPNLVLRRGRSTEAE